MATDDQGGSREQGLREPPAPEVEGEATGQPAVPETDQLLASMHSGPLAKTTEAPKEAPGMGETEPVTGPQYRTGAEDSLASLFDQPAGRADERPTEPPRPVSRTSPEPTSPTPVPLPVQPRTPEERQKLLRIRIVTVNDSFRVLNAFGETDDKTRGAIIEVGESFTALCESGTIDEAKLGPHG